VWYKQPPVAFAVYRSSPTSYIFARRSDLRAPKVAGGDHVSSSVEEKVISIVAEQLGVPKEEVTLESSIIEDLKADSLDVVELVMELEDEFDITIPDDDYEKLRTVGDAIRYIESKR
jgi:acyl carrier protein